ncbi:MAG: hypothetical protein M1839_006528 [Geoglossum umbratile]|nr:MAG: hypothetical protein M1839_006528 [Geoglossum umbratile]
MVRSLKFPSPSEQWPPLPTTSGQQKDKNSPRDARRSPSVPQPRRSIGLKNAKEEKEVVSPIIVTLTGPDREELTFGNELGMSYLVPRLHTDPSPTVLGQYRLSASSYTTRSLDDLTGRPSTDMSPQLHDSQSPSTSKLYYSPKTAPLSVSQQTSASSSRDLSLRKRHHGVAETREMSSTSPSPSVASCHLPEGVMSKSKFYKKRPPQLDLSLLFPKPQPSTGGLLSPDKLVHSPQQLSPASDTSPSEDAADGVWQTCEPLRGALSKESLKSKSYQTEGSRYPKPKSPNGNAKNDLQNLQNLLKRKVPTDVRSEIEEEDFVQRLAQNIQDRCPKVPKPLDDRGGPYRGQARKRNGTTGRSIQQATPTSEPSSRGSGSIGRGSSGTSSRKAAVPKRTGTNERYVSQQPCNAPFPGLAGRKSDSAPPSSSNGSGWKTTLSKKSSGSVFSGLDLREESALELSSGDESEVFGGRLGMEGEETEDDFIFQGWFEKPPWRNAGSRSSRSSYNTNKVEQMSKGSRKSSLMTLPKSMRHCVSFLRPREPQDNAGGNRKLKPDSTRFQSWLTEITPPSSPKSPSNTESLLTMAVSQEERDLLQAMREKRSILLGRLATDIPPETPHGSRTPILSPESSIWLPLERNSSPRKTEHRLSESRSSPGLRTEYSIDQSPAPLRSPSGSSHWIRRTPSFVRTSSLPSPPSSEPSPITPPAYNAMPGPMINCLLSASTSPSSTLYMHKYLPITCPKVTNGTFLDPETPASPLLDQSWRTLSTTRSMSRLMSASTSASSTKGDRGKYLGGRTASFDRLAPEDEGFYAGEGFTPSYMNGKATWHTAR